MLILVSSDTHLVPAFNTGGHTLTGDCEYAIYQLHRLVKSVKPELAIFPGDLCDSTRITVDELRLLKTMLDGIHGEGVTTAAINGNHDRGSELFAAVLAGTVDLNSYSDHYDFQGVKIKGIKNIADVSEYKKQISEVSGVDILVLHVSMSPFANFSGAAAATTDDCPPGIFTLVGDTHITQLYSNELPMSNGGKRVLSPGFLFPSNKEELLNKQAGICFLSVERNGDGIDVEVMQVELNQRKAFLIETHDDLQPDKILEHAEENTVNDDGHVLKPIYYINKDILADYKNPGLIIAQVVGTDERVVEDGEESAELVAMSKQPLADRAVSATKEFFTETDTPELQNEVTTLLHDLLSLPDEPGVYEETLVSYYEGR